MKSLVFPSLTMYGAYVMYRLFVDLDGCPSNGQFIDWSGWGKCAEYLQPDTTLHIFVFAVLGLVFVASQARTRRR